MMAYSSTESPLVAPAYHQIRSDLLYLRWQSRLQFRNEALGPGTVARGGVHRDRSHGELEVECKSNVASDLCVLHESLSGSPILNQSVPHLPGLPCLVPVSLST